MYAKHEQVTFEHYYVAVMLRLYVSLTLWLKFGQV